MTACSIAFVQQDWIENGCINIMLSHNQVWRLEAAAGFRGNPVCEPLI